MSLSSPVTSLILSLRGAAMLACLASGLVALIGGGTASADPRVESAELELALAASQRQTAALEQKVAALEKKLGTVGQSIAGANADSELVRAENTRLRKEIEALGVSALDSTAKGLRTKLKEALATLSEERTHSRKLSAQLLDLSEAARAYRSSAIARDPGTDQALGEAIHDSSQILGLEMIPDLKGGRLEKVQIVAIREDLELVVLDAGIEAGARIGMPLRLMRKDRVVGEAVIVDVRDNVAGAILQKLVHEADGPKVGDLALIDPNTLR